MPPVVPRKRLRSSPSGDSLSKKSKGSSATSTQAGQQRKSTLYDALDATNAPQSTSLLDDFNGEDDDSSSLTSLSDPDFEDVKPPVADKAGDSEDDEDVEFEDVAAPNVEQQDAPVVSGDLELTFQPTDRKSLYHEYYGDNKGPTKRDRQGRNAAHRVHVLTLLWHNAIRNAWVCDMEIQATMISHLTPRLWEEVERWMRNSGLVKEPPKPPRPVTSAKGKGKTKGKGKGKAVPAAEGRDWGSAAERLEEGAVNMSQGDPLVRLMQTLSAWWKQRFKITTPGIRKYGYMSLDRLDRWTKAWKNDMYNPSVVGEKLPTLDDFRRCARSCRGSRDVGAQLFTALLRGLGMEARMVANLQTLGFGWTKLEDAGEPKAHGATETTPKKVSVTPTSTGKSKAPGNEEGKTPKTNKTSTGSKKRTGRRTGKSDAIVIDDSDDLDLEFKDTDDESVVELEVLPRRHPNPTKRFDEDLEYPHYWTEVLSPVTQKYLPVDAIVKSVVATNRELVESFEPRGSKADKARQIMAYIVGYSSDGTAKDLTVRYLKRQMLPGRTKGNRVGLEKIPVHNRYGKVKRYEHFDWFKTALSGYTRGHQSVPITEIDELEEATDLKPAQPEKKEIKEGEETLQYYKQSKDFALERHLKREEALKPGAKPVKIFKNKAKGGKIEEEDVYLRKDVVNVKSAETWHKQGRAPLPGEQPLKRVPYRAATTNRRRELAEAEAATGQKVLQGLFSIGQTDWIIPPPIKDGVIPKNDYGNIDLFAEHMCPKGAVHIPYRGAVKVCKKLGIDYAEAVVDFEFGHRMAVPVIRGVVIAEEYHDQVMEQLEKDEAERARKEDEKRRKVALGKWRKFIMGMRIVERIQQEYGQVGANVSVFGPKKGLNSIHNEPVPQAHDNEETAGGFLPEGYEEEEEGNDDDARAATHHTSGFFATAAHDNDEDYDGHDDLVMEDHQGEGKLDTVETPLSVSPSPEDQQPERAPSEEADEAGESSKESED
ncbi:DNA repair protein-like protein [Emericellopsis cladophorae]|uniref:DNA repair protein-like protein n=1 Tax=Emericellopsis cladophorae TaxID=2686198 RepID=A0A9Q0BGS9_9HYPO|nr:DNA repair protein-like protein [Emericellopsis cladophorae]KAI6785327.1 DNA repair protein-like protein [Emericellopsis cladophorae]